MKPERFSEADPNPTLDFFRANVGPNLSQRSPSPTGRWLGGMLLAAEPGSLTVQFTVREEFCNPARILHGGIAATMMDDLMGITVFSLRLDVFFTSVNLNVDFLYAAPLGTTVVARSEVVRQGKKIIHAECRLTDEAGRLVAKATSNLVATSQSVDRAK